MSSFYIQKLGDSSLPKLVFLHGLMGSAANWRSIIPFFQDDFHILVYDQRGHGRSCHPPSGYAPEDYADDLNQITEEENFDEFFLMGHSMGGRNALCFAARYPKKVRALALEDIGLTPNIETVRRTQRMIEFIPTPFTDKAQARNFLRGPFREQLSVWGYDDPDVMVAYLYSNLRTKEDASVDWRFFRKGIIETLQLGRTREAWSDLQAVECPSLMIRGASSEELSEEEVNKMQKEKPSMEIETVQEAGHWVHFNQKEEFCRILKKFFSNYC